MREHIGARLQCEAAAAVLVPNHANLQDFTERGESRLQCDAGTARTRSAGMQGRRALQRSTHGALNVQYQRKARRERGHAGSALASSGGQDAGSSTHTSSVRNMLLHNAHQMKTCAALRLATRATHAATVTLWHYKMETSWGTAPTRGACIAACHTCNAPSQQLSTQTRHIEQATHPQCVAGCWLSHVPV